MHPESTFHLANQLLDENNFAEAVSIFREAATKTEPTAAQLANLDIAESEECTSFRRALCHFYPHSVACRVALIQALEDAGHANISVESASALLSDYRLTDTENISVRFLRLRIAINTDRGDIVIDDFSSLWRSRDSTIQNRQYRGGILRAVASCRNTAMSGTLLEMSLLPFVEKDVSAFLRAKASEMDLLRVVASLE